MVGDGWQEAFEEYKNGEGNETVSLLKENQTSLRDKKKQKVEIAQQINGTKAKIDDLKNRSFEKKTVAGTLHGDGIGFRQLILNSY